MFRYFAALLIIATALCTNGINHGIQESKSNPVSDTERYAVYSTVLKEVFVDDSNKLLVIEDKTADDFTADNDKHWDYLKQGLAPISQATIDDFKSKNAKTSSLEDKFTVTIKTKLISKAEVDKFFAPSGGWWEAFYKSYPNSPGLITFSNVGFNSDGSQALLYIGHSCGGLCGTGHYVLLTKNNGAWRVEKKVMTWIS